MSGEADLHGEGGQFVYPDWYPTPLALKAVDLKLHVSSVPQRLVLDRIAIDLGDAKVDGIGTADFAAMLEAHGVVVPPILATAAGRPFWRVEGAQRQVLGLDGAYHDVPRAEGVLLLADVKRAGKPLLRNGSAALRQNTLRTTQATARALIMPSA